MEVNIGFPEWDGPQSGQSAWDVSEIILIPLLGCVCKWTQPNMSLFNEAPKSFTDMHLSL